MNTTLTDASCAETNVDENCRLMAELSITRHGRYYHFEGYRYELLADAIAFAELVRARSSQPAQRPQQQVVEKCDVPEGPSAADRQLMQEFSISFENHSFVFERFRYDQLRDAVNYARHCRELASN
ncbi:MAG: hypothetical protein HC872_07025 [Gammaproteobacteria bacterium]|nr:hypothetical protein [Gammaproteobacteria bacterium]